MELVKALEQLSLEVRNQNHKSDDKKAAHFSQDQQYLHLHANCTQSAEDKNQLLEFDNSIDTLLNQIADLNCQDTISNDRDVSKRRANFRQPHYFAGSSLETSQEEDSDCSSQRSESTQTNQSVILDPFVRDLLKRDIGSITETVRKIGQILALGKDIESIYKSLKQNYSTQLLPDNFNHDKIQEKIDYDVVSSICAKFTRTCRGETHIANLPTIVRYQDYCNKLLMELERMMNNQHSTERQIDRDDEMELSEEDGDVDEEDFSCEDLVADTCCLVDCDQKPVDNWTDNKLYINHQNPSTSNNWQ